MTRGRLIDRHVIVPAVIYTAAAVGGITWGLPSRAIDRYLFPTGNVWPGEKIHRLAGAGEKLSESRLAVTGADVDIDPLRMEPTVPIQLNATNEDIARILLRYRLYTYQPDEMITMMALAGMRPRQLDLDPRLYQYGGLFIYPVGGIIRLGGALGLLDVRNDLVFYLDHPDEFARFYIAARLYSAAWGLLGLFVVAAIAREIARAADSGAGASAPAPHDRVLPEPGRTCQEPLRASTAPSGPRLAEAPICSTGAAGGMLAALLFAIMPVVICMAHEAKPHLAGAVLMLSAVLFGMRHVATTNRAARRAGGRAEVGEAAPSNRNWWWMCLCCGAAVGMVLSAVPILVLIPLVACMAGSPNRSWASLIARTSAGCVAAGCVYLVTNPYVAINAIVNRDVLRSNFGNSLAMYEVARIGEGFRRVLDLTLEGATLPVVVLGLGGLAVAILRRNYAAMVLAVPAGILFLQFVLIGAGKPAEYGRFGIFTNAALAISTASVIGSQWRRKRSLAVGAAATMIVLWVGIAGAAYVRGFQLDAAGRGTRMRLAAELANWLPDQPEGSWQVALNSEPAPYNCPPLDLSAVKLVLALEAEHENAAARRVVLRPVDHLPQPDRPNRSWPRLWPSETPISWANKPFSLQLPQWTYPGPG